MLVTLVVRLVGEGLADGRFVGQVEHVGNGQTTVVHGVADLLGFAQQAALDNQDSTDRVGASENHMEVGR